MSTLSPMSTMSNLSTLSTLSNMSPMSPLEGVCSVCGATAPSHSHYGALSCFPCRSFFRRGIQFTYMCVMGGNSCMVDMVTRKSCPKCRFDKCLKAGMLPELVNKSVRRRKTKGKGGKGNEDKSPKIKVDDKRVVVGSIHNL